MTFSITSITDKTDGTIIYYGEANIGSGIDEPRWSVRRLKKDAVTKEWKLEWSNGDTMNNDIWDNRTTLEYS